MKLKDVLLWSAMGVSLVLFMPIGLVLLAYIIITTISKMFFGEEIERKTYKEDEISEEELEKAR